jgi:hypothetical protein
MSFDIVIPFKRSKSDDEELRYALRSIEKNLSGYGNVYLVGDKPSWVRNVEHLNIHDYPNHRQSSVCTKVLAACQLPELSQKFLRWDDDHYLLKSMQVTDIKYWYSQTLSEWMKRKMGAAYRDVLQKAIDLYGDVPYYDIHTPIIFDKDLYSQEMACIAREKTEVLIKTSYCIKAGVQGVEMKEKDLKIDAPRVHWEIQRLIQGRTFFSVGEFGFNLSMRKVLQAIYPKKSKYE